MRGEWKRVRRWGGSVVDARAATGSVMTYKPDRRRQIDALIDYFGTSTTPRVSITDGPFVETKELPGGPRIGA